MFASIAWAALRRRPFYFLATFGLVVVFSSLLGLAAPLAVLSWLALALVGIELWYVLEPLALRHLGARALDRVESERLQTMAAYCGCELLIVDHDEAWLVVGLRVVVMSRGLLEVVDDNAINGLIAQASIRLGGYGSALGPAIWLGATPFLVGWLAARALVRIAEVLASVIGASLILPALLFPRAFRRVGGLILGTTFVWLIGATLISDGARAIGLALLVGWAVVAGLRALNAWEARRDEALADRLTAERGLGEYLRSALELLACCDGVAEPHGVFRLLAQPGAPLQKRVARLHRLLGQAPKRAA